MCAVICCSWAVGSLSNTDRPLHLQVRLCGDFVHDHSPIDLFDFPSDNDCLGKVYVAIRKWIYYRVIVTRSRLKNLAIIAWVSAIVTVSPTHFITALTAILRENEMALALQIIFIILSVLVMSALGLII